MSGDDTHTPAPPTQLLGVIANLAKYHREHEEFYSQAPLRQAGELQRASRALTALAERWNYVAASERPAVNPYEGAEDLNAPGLVAESGILFMEGEGEPVEFARLKRDLATIASDCEQSGEWLADAMQHSWQAAAGLVPFPGIADLLGERHRIIANDWQAAGISSLAGRLVARALELLEQVRFEPAALREDLTGSRSNPGYLYSAAELLGRASDLLAESAILVHDNERRWRVFSERIASLRSDDAASPG